MTDSSLTVGEPASEPTIECAARWLRESVWPLWLEHGIDYKARAFYEHLEPSTLTCSSEFRRLRVVTRQTYVFSCAAAAGVPKAKAAVELGVEFLQSRARLSDGGYAWRFSLDNKATDRTRDLYDHAFVLLALSAASPILGRDAVCRDARELLDYILENFRHMQIGFEESLPPSRPRRQNPHMHLLEACLAAFDAFDDEYYLDTAAAIADLAIDRLFQSAEGALPEFFDENLRPIRKGGLFRVEPGHHFEWVWLLDWYGQAMTRTKRPINRNAGLVSDALAAFADRFGLDAATGLAVDGLSSDGSVVENHFRLWPQTERIKAAARSAHDAHSRTVSAVKAFNRFLIDAPVGLWHERLDRAVAAIRGPSPATSLYHITCALTDTAVIRLAARDYQNGR